MSDVSPGVFGGWKVWPIDTLKSQVRWLAHPCHERSLRSQ